MSRRSGRSTTPARRRARRNNAAPTACAATLATAEPVRPRPAGYTSSGDSSADSALATSTMTTGSRVRWTPRIQPLPARTSSTPGMPSTAIRNQSSAACWVGLWPPASRVVSGAASASPSPAITSADDRAQPRRLHALADRGRLAAGAVPARRPRGRAVLDERPDDGQQRHQRRAHAEPGERPRPEVPDDRGVDEQVQRLGREHDEGRGGQRQQPAGVGGDGRRAQRGRPGRRGLTRSPAR